MGVLTVEGMTFLWNLCPNYICLFLAMVWQCTIKVSWILNPMSRHYKCMLNVVGWRRYVQQGSGGEDQSSTSFIQFHLGLISLVSCLHVTDLRLVAICSISPIPDSMWGQCPWIFACMLQYGPTFELVVIHSISPILDRKFRGISCPSVVLEFVCCYPGYIAMCY